MGYIARSTYLTGQSYLVLTIDYAGRTHYLSTDTFDITTDDGGSVQVLDAIEDIRWKETLSLFSDSPEAVSVPLSIVVPDVDFGDLISRGYDLAAATGELARWVVGTTWESRQVLLKGEVSEPSHGGPDEPVRFSLSRAPFDDRSSMIDADAVVDSTSWPDADDVSLGQTYPHILGGPGLPDAGPIAASPGYVVDDTATQVTLLVAGHHVVAATVDVRNVDNGTAYATKSVTNTTDGRGRDVAVVTLGDGAGAGEYDSTTVGNQYMVSWPALGGMPNDRQDGALEGAGDVLLRFLRLSTLDVDTGRAEAVRAYLNAWRIEGYYDEDVSYWEWIRSNLLPLLPVSIISGADGLFPVVWPYEATAEDAVEWLDVDRLDAERSSDVQYGPIDEIANEIRISFAYNANKDRHRRLIRATGRPELRAEYDRQLYATSALRVSRSRYGVAAMEVTTDVVYGRATAAKVLNWLSYAHAVPTRLVSVLLGPQYRHLEVGAVVVLTDSEISWTDQVCWVEAIQDVDGPSVEVTLRTIEKPAQVR